MKRSDGLWRFAYGDVLDGDYGDAACWNIWNTRPLCGYDIDVDEDNNHSDTMSSVEIMIPYAEDGVAEDVWAF